MKGDEVGEVLREELEKVSGYEVGEARDGKVSGEKGLVKSGEGIRESVRRRYTGSGGISRGNREGKVLGVRFEEVGEIRKS